MVKAGTGKTGRRNTTFTLSEIAPQLPEELTHQAKLRKAVQKQVSEADVAAVVKSITERAKNGEPAAVKQFMQYVLGEGTPITFVQNNYYDDAPPAESPIIDPPGSEGRIEHLRRRQLNGAPLFTDGDNNGHGSDE